MNSPDSLLQRMSVPTGNIAWASSGLEQHGPAVAASSWNIPQGRSFTSCPARRHLARDFSRRADLRAAWAAPPCSVEMSWRRVIPDESWVGNETSTASRGFLPLGPGKGSQRVEFSRGLWWRQHRNRPRCFPDLGRDRVVSVAMGRKLGAVGARAELEELEGEDDLEESGNGVAEPLGGEVEADFLPDAEMNTVALDIQAIERQSEAVAKQITEHARLLAEASRRLQARAQATRLEAAKVKKLARQQQVEDLRRRDELRRLRTLEMESRRQQAQAASKQAAAMDRAPQVEGEPRAPVEQVSPYGTAAAAGVEAAAAAPECGADGTEMLIGLSAGVMGAAVFPFPFPNGRSSGQEVDSSALTGGAPVGLPVVDGAGAPLDGLAGEGSRGPDGAAQGAGSFGAVAVHESQECIITHPGAMSCTRTVVKKDTAQRVAVVSMETTVRCAGDGCAVGLLDVNDFAALAMATLAETATELKHSRRFQVGPDADPRVQQRRQEIEELLASGDILSACPMEPPSKFGHESFIVRLRSRTTGKEVKAMFKPRVEGDADGWHRAPVEWVAYELNMLLGMDYIPPVAYRTGGVDLGERRYREGAMVYWVPSAKELRRVPAPNWGVSVVRLLSDTRILDILLNNSDRHHGHFLFGEHWADGRMRVILIDHAAGFRNEAVVTMEHENAFQTGPVRCASAHTYLRLRFLDRAMLEAKFLGVLSPDELTALLERKDKVLAYLDELVQERGYHRTVVE